MASKQFTTKRIATGQFECYWNGVKTDWTIVNGCAGLTGRDSVNIYVVVNEKLGKHIPLGPLNTCKKMVEYACRKADAPLPNGIKITYGR